MYKITIPVVTNSDLHKKLLAWKKFLDFGAYVHKGSMSFDGDDGLRYTARQVLPFSIPEVSESSSVECEFSAEEVVFPTE